MNRATVWPAHGNVQSGPGRFGEFLTGPREVDLDDSYWAARLRDGSVLLTDPTPAPAAEPEKV